MSSSNRTAIDIDDAETIRKFSEHIHRASSHQASATENRQSANEGSYNGNAHATAPAETSPFSNETLFERPHAHHNMEHVDGQAPHPRALQQVLDESPQLKGIQAPHPTPESHRPSPSLGAEEPPDYSNEEVGMALNHVFGSLPNAGKYGIDDSIWAKKTRPRTIIARQDEARKRSAEHNDTFERMSFKVADAPSKLNPFIGNATRLLYQVDSTNSMY